MTTIQSQEASLQQLRETITQLANTVAASERRHTAISRTVRYGALAFVVFVAAVGYAASDMIVAYASQQSWWNQIEGKIAHQPPEMVPDPGQNTVGKILMSLASTEALDAALVKVLQSAAAIAATEAQSTPTFLECVNSKPLDPSQKSKGPLCFAKAAVEDLGQYYLNDDGKLPVLKDPQDPQAVMKHNTKMMEATFMAAGQIVVDASVLVHRLRRDSDFLRSKAADPGLSGIKDELARLNMVLRAVPVMATEMNVMNRHMGTMSYSMGSTMGRMGNIMPW
jgi:hypothetical protein